MHIPVAVELDYRNSGPQTIPAGQTVDFSYPAPPGWIGISWGYTAVHPVLEFQSAGYVLDETGQQRFLATVRNPSGTDRPMRWTFLLMKV